MHQLYSDLAPWWPLLSPPEGYADESSTYLSLLESALGHPARSLLELGSGAGLHGSHMPAELDVHLLDIASEMLAVSREHNPGRAHHQADMRTARLGRQFEAVLLHDAVMYLLSEADLRATYATAFEHLKPGGVVLVLPDLTRENWEDLTTGGGTSHPDGRAARLLEWRWDPDPADCTFQLEFAYLLRDSDGTVRHLHESHTMGLFSRAEHVHALVGAGFELLEPDPLLAMECAGEPFLARRPNPAQGQA